MQLEIKRIQESLKITTISVTHDQEEALTMSSRICIINEGRVEQTGTPTEIYQQPDNRFVADFIGETNLLDGEVKGWEEDIAIIRTKRGETIKAVTINKQLKDVTFSIRPELISITKPEGRNFENILSGTVKEIVYVGDSSRCKLMTEKGEEILIKLSPKEIPFVSEGQKLYVGWDVNEGVLLNK